MSNENALAIAAINEEARKRGLTYGQLMGQLSHFEKQVIIQEFNPGQAEKRRRASGTKFKESQHKK